MKIVLILIGAISLVLGVAGIVIPLLPTTPFLLLTAALWVRASPRLYTWLVASPWLGEYIRNYRENRAIPLRAKIVSLTVMWATMLWCIIVPLSPWLWAQLSLGVVALAVTWHILSFTTLTRK